MFHVCDQSINPRERPPCKAGALSAYNATREGFIFSDGAVFGLPADGSDPAAAAEFEGAMAGLYTFNPFDP